MCELLAQMDAGSLKGWELEHIVSACLPVMLCPVMIRELSPMKVSYMLWDLL